jgi:hypothetical protein
MGKKSTVIALIAICFGVVGIGFGAFTMINFQTQLNTRTGVSNSWYDTSQSMFSPDSGTQFVVIPGLSVDITVNTGENVFISYIGTALLIDTRIEYKICINNYDQQYGEVSSDDANDILTISIALQHVNQTINPGTYTVNVWVREEIGTGLTVYANTLFVQTFIP